MAAKEETRVLVLDAAIRLIASGGLQALTHRAVEAEAGVAHGTTTYYFGSRRQMVDAVLEHLAQRDMAAARQAGAAPGAARSGPVDLDAVADLMVRMVASDRGTLLARYELMLEVGRRPELREALARWRESFVAACRDLLAGLGVHEADLAARWWVAALDGLLLDELCVGTARFPQHARAMLRAMLQAAHTLGDGTPSTSR